MALKEKFPTQATPQLLVGGLGSSGWQSGLGREEVPALKCQGAVEVLTKTRDQLMAPRKGGEPAEPNGFSRRKKASVRAQKNSRKELLGTHRNVSLRKRRSNTLEQHRGNCGPIY